jgi:hypothetical protein
VKEWCSSRPDEDRGVSHTAVAGTSRDTRAVDR